MPQAAIDTGFVDRVVPLEQIAPLLAELGAGEQPAARGAAA